MKTRRAKILLSINIFFIFLHFSHFLFPFYFLFLIFQAKLSTIQQSIKVLGSSLLQKFQIQKLRTNLNKDNPVVPPSPSNGHWTKQNNTPNSTTTTKKRKKKSEEIYKLCNNDARWIAKPSRSGEWTLETSPKAQHPLQEAKTLKCIQIISNLFDKVISRLYIHGKIW